MSTEQINIPKINEPQVDNNMLVVNKNEDATQTLLPEVVADELTLPENLEDTNDQNQERDSQRSGNPNKQLEHLVSVYLKSDLQNYKKSYQELEGRFGTRGTSITKINFDNVISKLLSSNFSNKMDEYRLSIYPQFLDSKSGVFRKSNIRTEILGINTIQQYCNDNNIETILDSQSNASVKFIKKTNVFVENKKLFDVIFNDFNFIVSYKNETQFSKNANLIKSVRTDWVNRKKTFRYMNRTRFTNSEYPVFIDLSIVRSSMENPTYTLDESHTFDTPETYEIEFEIDPTRVGPGTKYSTVKSIVDIIHKISKLILSGLQGTNYPISFSKQNEVLQAYLKLINANVDYTRVSQSNFIGPSTLTLQTHNIIQIDPNIKEPNIRTNFCVTDKADGLRHIMFIKSDGLIYLINMNMDVIFTGAITKNEKVFNTLIDGELIRHDKNHEFVNVFIAFDIYFINNQNVRHHKFIQTGVGEVHKTVYRYSVLKDVIDILKPVSVVPGGEVESPMKFRIKRFLFPDEHKTIFDCCKEILSSVSVYPYNTDGLIFTHTIFGVGSNFPGKAGPLRKVGWKYSFKWKPPSMNTIDFLVETKKEPSGQDIISTIYRDGVDVNSPNVFIQYKTLVLKCGFNERRDGYINPSLDVIEDKPISQENDDESPYKAVQFYPLNPTDSSAGLCNIQIRKNANNQNNMFTEENEVFEDDMIVEFRFDKVNYDKTGKALLSWIPIRVRYDKTVEYRKSKSENNLKGPNSYETANSNWHSINNPITEEMLSTGQNIVSEKEEDVYYKNGAKSSLLKGMRKFHNLYVKHLLIKSVCEPDNTLIDFACGKAGDLPKWIDAKLKFVFGIDLFRDNLENRVDGACARYLNYRKKYVDMPKALFVNGDSSINIRDGSSMKSELSKKITLAVFGQGEKNEGHLGKGVYSQFGVGMNGFNVSSCQFAIHYFFKDTTTFHNFLRNVAECTALNGYFIGTCYDGKTVFNKLKRHETGDDGLEFYENGKKMCQIIKNYDDSEDAILEDDETCIGKEILVYQDSINQISEYLVNYDYLVRIMENYGLVPFKKEGLPNASGLFKELFYQMTNEIHRFKYKEFDYIDALNMSDPEKEISFLNRYFVFKKVRNIENFENIANNFISTELDAPPIHSPEVKKLSETIFIQEDTKEIKPKRKYTRKVVPKEDAPPEKEAEVVVVEKEYTNGEILKEVDYILVELPQNKIKMTTIYKELATRLNKKNIKKTHGKLIEEHVNKFLKNFTADIE